MSFGIALVLLHALRKDSVAALDAVRVAASDPISVAQARSAVDQDLCEDPLGDNGQRRPSATRREATTHITHIMRANDWLIGDHEQAVSVTHMMRETG